jgi:predicted nucleic acid-binding protein
LILLDANVFIEAKNRYYGFDICPGFWDWMDQVFDEDVKSVRPVWQELMSGDDELADWAKSRKEHSAILSVDDEAVQVMYGSIANHVVEEAEYHASAAQKFLDGADPWIVAAAAVSGATIVTHEMPQRGVKRRVPIPNICEHFGLNFVNTFDVLRERGVKFGISA